VPIQFDFMERTTAKELPVGIKVAAAMQLPLQHLAEEGPDAASFRAYLSRFVGDLVEDLRLPVQVSLSLKSVDESDPLGRPYRIWIGGRECRVRLLPMPPGATATTMARLVAQDIFRNRELFVTDQVTDALAQHPQSGNSVSAPAALSTGKACPVLLDLVRRCFRLDRAKGAAPPAKGSGQSGHGPALAEQAAEVWDSLGLKIWLNRDQYNTLQAQDGADPSLAVPGTPLGDMWQKGQTFLYDELGIFMPKVEVGLGGDLAAGEFRIQINDLRLPSCHGPAGSEFAVWSETAALAQADVSCRRTLNPWGGECAIVEDKNEAAQKCRNLGLEPVDPLSFVAVYLGAEIRYNATAFLNGEVVQYALNLARVNSAATVTAALSRFDLTTLGRILRNLLEEDISIKDLRSILEALLSAAGTTDVDTRRFLVISPIAGRVFPGPQRRRSEELDCESYADCARMSLRRYITRKYSASSDELNAYLIDSDVDEAIRKIDLGSFCSDEHVDLLRAILEAGLIKGSRNGGMPVIVAQPATRRKLQWLIQNELPQLAVLNYYELLPGIKIKEVGRISRTSLGGAPSLAAV
jgi:type III secretory pathway component EscV